MDTINFRAWDLEKKEYTADFAPIIVRRLCGTCGLGVLPPLLLEPALPFNDYRGTQIYVGDVLTRLENVSLFFCNTRDRESLEWLRSSRLIVGGDSPDKRGMLAYYRTGEYSTPFEQPDSDLWLKGTPEDEDGRYINQQSGDWMVVGNVHEDKWENLLRHFGSRAGFWQDQDEIEALKDCPFVRDIS